MKKIFQIFVMTVSLSYLMACGKLNLVSLASGIFEDEGTGSLYFFATDFSSSGQLFQAQLNDATVSAENSGMVGLGSSAILRHAEGHLFLLHDGFSSGSSDNVQIIESGDVFTTVGQFSTGNGTNPHDAVVKDQDLYISLYNPLTESSTMGDVVRMDWSNGNILKAYSFSDFLNDDGDQNANADQMVLLDGILYVCLQDLESTSFDANSPGLIGMIDIDDDSIEGVITLQGRNPVDIVASPNEERLFVANMALYDENLAAFDLDTPYGGIEVIDVNSRQTSLFIDDASLGGYVERLIVSDETVFAVVSQFDSASFSYLSKIVEIPQNISSQAEISTFTDFEFDIRDIFVQKDILWVSKRVINSASGISEPKLAAYSISTGEISGSDFDLEVPATSLAGE